MQNLGPAGTRLTHHIDDVFDRNRNAAQRKIDIRLLGLLGGSVHVEREISADFSIYRFDAGSQRIDDFARGNFPATQQRLQIGDAQRR